MMVLQTLLVLYLWVWTIPTCTFARPCPQNTNLDPNTNSTSLLCTEGDLNPSPEIDPTPTASTITLSVREWPEYPTFKPSTPKRKKSPGIPTPVAIMLPAITAFTILGGLCLCAFRKGKGTSETGGQVWGDSAVDNQVRQGDSQPLPPREPQQRLGVDEVYEVPPPPPYWREPPK